MLSLEGFGLAGKPAAATAAGAILYYVRSTQRGTLDHVDRIGFYERQNCLVLDAVTVRNLELIEPLFRRHRCRRNTVPFDRCDGHAHGQAPAALVDAAAVARLQEINARLDAVEAEVKDTVAREELRRALDGMLDLERLLSRVTLETANPRDVLALAASLAKFRRCERRWQRFARERLQTLCTRSVDELADLRERIEATIVAEPPLSLSDGGVIPPASIANSTNCATSAATASSFWRRSNSASGSAPESRR